MSQWKRVGLAVLTGLLAFQLTAVGLMQVTGAEPIAGNFGSLGLPGWLRPVVGGVQLACVPFLFLTRWRFPAALLLTTVLVGAVAAHLRVAHSAEQTLPAIVTLGLLGVLTWGRRPRTE